MRSCDPCQIIAWGTSFAGMHVLELAVSDNRLAAAVAQAPLTDGPAAAMMSEPKNGTRLFGLALLDRVGPVWPPAAIPVPSVPVWHCHQRGSQRVLTGAGSIGFHGMELGV